MNAVTPFAVLVSHAHVAVKDRVLISVQLPLVLMLLALLHATLNSQSRPRPAKRCHSVSADRRLRSCALLLRTSQESGPRSRSFVCPELFACTGPTRASCSCVRSDPSSQPSHGPKPHLIVWFASPSLPHPIRGDDLCRLRQPLASASCT